MAQRESVCVVGGGLVGPIAALLMARRGYRVALYERGDDPALSARTGGRSVHLVVSERGWRTLRAVGLDAEVRKICMPLRGRTIHMHDGTQRFQAYGRDDQAIFAVQRSALNRLVATAASQHPGITAHFRHRCQGIDLETLTLQFLAGDDNRPVAVNSDIILAADGAFSRVREALTHTERYDYSQEYMKYGYKELSIPCTADGRFPLDHHTMHVWPRKRLMLTAFPNPNHSFTGMLVMPFEGETSFASITSAEQLNALFQREFADAVPLMPAVCDDYLQRPVSSLVTIHCYPWVYRDRVALIGDAAHAMVPFFGQGMNVGYEDCLVLDHCLEQHNGHWPSALAEYQQRRKPNCDAVTEMSLQNFIELSENVGNPQILLQRRLEQRIHELYPERFIPLYPMVAFSNIEYTEAQHNERAQQAIIQQIMATCDVAECWGTPVLDEVIHRVMVGEF